MTIGPNLINILAKIGLTDFTCFTKQENQRVMLLVLGENNRLYNQTSDKEMIEFLHFTLFI